MKKNILPIILCLSALTLTGCALTHEVDDVDLAHYVHHVNHFTFTLTHPTIAEVSIKPFYVDEADKYTFTDIVWTSEEFDWTGFCEEYDSSKYPEFNFTSISILNDGVATGFVNNLYDGQIYSLKKYSDDIPDEYTEETRFITRKAELFGQQLTLLRHWQVLAYSSKTPIYEEGDGEITGYNYEDLHVVNITSEQVYIGESLKFFRCYVGGKGLYIPHIDEGYWEYNENFRAEAITYLEYKVSFR